jgi:hypothetical protein
MLMTVWYSKSKFDWTHELCLGIAAGPLPALIGAVSVGQDVNLIQVVLVSLPIAIILSFAGLALDEWPDAEANLKKGVKSLANRVWKYSDYTIKWIPATITYIPQWQKGLQTLNWYLSTWLIFMVVFHIFLISIGYLHPLTGLAFLTVPGLIACMLLLSGNFYRVANWFVIFGALYLILILVGQIYGG